MPRTIDTGRARSGPDPAKSPSTGDGRASSKDPNVTETTGLLYEQSERTRPSIEKKPEVHYRGPISGARFAFLLVSILFGSMIAFFDSTLMASAHPVITSYFNASNAASWFSTVFYLTSTVFQPLYGRISDTIGRKPVYLFAIVMFFSSTAWCGAAPDLMSFIAARAVCGLGAGGVISMAGILTSDVVKIEYRGIYQSYFNMSYGAGTGLGAALGGWLCDRFGWRMAFYAQLPFILLFSILAIIACPSGLGPNLAKTRGQSIRQAFKSFDTYGAIGLSTTTTSLIMGVNLGGNIFSWTHPLVITSLVLFIVAATSLYFIERKAEFPILPIPLLSTNPNASMMWANFFGAIVVNTVLFNIPLYLQAVRQTTPTASGMYLLVPLLGISITAVFVGYYITITRDMKSPMKLGTVVLFLGAILVTTCLSPEIPTWAIPMLIPFCSIGQGLTFPPTTIALLAVNSQDEQAVVTTTLGLIRSVGSILGVAVSSWVLQNALLFFLQEYVTSSDPAKKAWIIRTARESIRSIRDLDPKHKSQVTAAYAASLRVTFVLSIALSIICIVLIWPLKLPRLQSHGDGPSVWAGGVDGADEEDDRPKGGPLGLLDAREQVAVDYEDDAALLDAIAEGDESGAHGFGSSAFSDDDNDDDTASASGAGLSRTTTRSMSRASNSLPGSLPRGSAVRRQRSRRASFDVQWR